jgi:hypothetical protein
MTWLLTLNLCKPRCAKYIAVIIVLMTVVLW